MPSEAANKTVDKKVNSPQMWLTLMWHVGTGLPWDWRSGPSGSSEREHMTQMIPDLPAGSLVTADAGFVGYEYWKALLDAGHAFVIRVGSNVQLLKKLGYFQESENRVYLWPERRARNCEKPLTLRLVKVNGSKSPVYLVTSVLSSRKLSDRQVTAMYKRRWGVELYYRGFKQTFERRKLRSGRADHSQLELDWSLIGLWAVCLYALHHQAPQQLPASRLSVAGTLRAIRKPMREYKSRPDDGEDLYALLEQAITDDYHRGSKASRDYPRKKKKEPPAGKPIIRTATKAQILQAQKLKRNQAPQGLTA